MSGRLERQQPTFKDEVSQANQADLLFDRRLRKKCSIGRSYKLFIALYMILYSVENSDIPIAILENKDVYNRDEN